MDFNKDWFIGFLSGVIFGWVVLCIAGLLLGL